MKKKINWTSVWDVISLVFSILAHYYGVVCVGMLVGYVINGSAEALVLLWFVPLFALVAVLAAVAVYSILKK